jgi:hypothetical protein
MTDTQDPGEDMRLRWLPTRRAVKHARALLAAEPEADVALIPMYQPGKQYGIWLTGQIVTTVPGVVFVAANSFHTAGSLPTLSWARNKACDIARERLRVDGQVGTVAYAVVRPDTVAVFEDFGDLT